MKAILLGATKGIGRAIGRQLAERGEDIFLLGRHAEELELSARDLEIRSGRTSTIGTARCDLLAAETFDSALNAAVKSMGSFDTVIITAAHFATQSHLEDDERACRDLLLANFTNTVLFCEKARKRLMSTGGGTLCVLSSVAGERGRKPVVLYGATKAGLSAYLEGLDHKFRNQGLVTVCVKPGFVKTGMTASLSPPPFAGEPDGVARSIIRAIDRKTPEIYTPGIWRWILAVIRLLPRWLMRRLNF